MRFGMLELHFLGSGSRGNAMVIGWGRTRILLDCGFSNRAMTHRLAQVGLRPASIRAVLITHEHTDHVKGLARFAGGNHLPVFLSGRTLPGVVPDHAAETDLHLVQPGRGFAIDGIEILPFATPHDARQPVGYVFRMPNGCRLGVATDLGHANPEVVEALAGCDYLGLETNHDPGLLRSGPYPAHLKRRIQSSRGHLSNRDAAALLERLATGRLKHLFALHLSETNNRPALARAALTESIRRLGLDVPVTVVEQHLPVSPLSRGQLRLF